MAMTLLKSSCTLVPIFNLHSLQQVDEVVGMPCDELEWVGEDGGGRVC